VSAIVDRRERVAAPAGTPALADPSGRRARVLKRVGCALGVILALWVVGLVLAGLGLFPGGDLPLGRVLAGGGDPPATHAPSIWSGAAHHGRAALGASPPSAPAGAHQKSGAVVAHRRAGSSPSAGRATPVSPGSTTARKGAAATGSAAGRSAPHGGTPSTGASSASAAGGRGRSAYGHSRSALRSRSGSAPGRVKRTGSAAPVAPGKSGSAPRRRTTPSRPRGRTG
jgi:hypothetical protein